VIFDQTRGMLRTAEDLGVILFGDGYQYWVASGQSAIRTLAPEIGLWEISPASSGLRMHPSHFEPTLALARGAGVA
jgi:predicted DNA-binding protein (UPF0278 family)